MTRTAIRHGNDMRGDRGRCEGRGPGNFPMLELRRTLTVTAALLGLVLGAAGCGGSNPPGVAAGGGGSAGGGPRRGS
jgi:hypothetical protein